ncbi:MAG: ABC transporter substrate-binding protein [Planctomycetes bacterium]|nr:ABC transporter substrate-binding protein [Planctomycetota bacterium]
MIRTGLQRALVLLTTGVVIASLGVLGGAYSQQPPVFAQPAPEPPKPRSIVVNSSGGIVNQVLRQVFLSVYEQRYGIRVIDTSPTDFAKLQAMVRSGNVEWNVTEISGIDGFRAIKLGLLEPIDFAIVNVSDFPRAVVNDHLLPMSFFSTIMAYRTDVFPVGRRPRSWADFWDIKKFPGPRALQNTPVDNLEFALLADGVPPERLYPLDVTRAFRKLDEVKPHITVWWTTGAQSPQLLVDKEVVLATAWNARIMDIMRKGAPVGMEWNHGLLKIAYVAIPRGARDVFWSQKMLAIFADAELQGKWTSIIPYPGPNLKAMAYVDPALRPFLPTYEENLKKQIVQKDAWWEENMARIQERWNRWMLQR